MGIRNTIIKIEFTDCTGLPTDLENVITETSFTVLCGTKITVKCKDGYSKQSGDTEITCAGGTSFDYTTKLDCKKGKVKHGKFQ